MPRSFVLRSRRVVTPHGVVRADVVVLAGVIQAIEPLGSGDSDADKPTGPWPDDLPLLDYGDQVVMPGLVDTHVHVNEPGRTEWEGFRTATQAAAAGGVTTLVDMPLNSVPATTTVEALAAKRAAAAGQCRVDVGFWGGVVPGNATELAALWDAGVLGFKAFLVPSGVDEFEAVAVEDLEQAVPVLAHLDAPLLVHAEDPAVIAAHARTLERSPASERRRYATYLASRPPAAELAAIDLLLDLARRSGAHVHVVHLAAAEALPRLAAARQEGLRVTVETCPHYLTFDAESIPDGATEHKCAPPLRSAANREALWQGLGDGTIDLVASDHSPSPPEMKQCESGDFLHAWGGIASLEVTLPALWTEARARGFALDDVARWMAAEPARLAGLAGRKGAIAVGCDADFVIWDPDASFHVEPARLHHRHPLTPYAGRELAGVVAATYLCGRKVFEHGKLVGEPTGELLSR